MSEGIVARAHGPRAWAAQFRDLGGRDPALWPLLPRITCALAAMAAVVAAGGWFAWSPQWEALEDGRAAEQRLRTAFEQKQAQAQHLDTLRRRKLEVQAVVDHLERQLPGKAEMDALLADISRAGALRGLQFELFKPGQVRIADHHAELPVEMRLAGSFHALAGFVSDVANLRRIVSIERISISHQRDKLLAFECTALAYRYLEPGEAAAARQSAVDLKRTPRR
jgi:type IV pilus assembly protein PilO